jgi:hypothetical protein
VITTARTEAVAVVGSPSSNREVTLDLLGGTSNSSLVGSMIFFEQELGERHELALGTVTEVTTVNRWHENTSMRGVVKQVGHLPNLSGVGDVRDAQIRVQAVYQRPRDALAFCQGGASLSMSPATGLHVFPVDDEVLQAVLAGHADDVVYLGRIHRMQALLPLSIGDFSSEEGGFHSAVFGLTGSGKSALSSYLLAAQMRHTGMGIVIVDPQGQWSTQRGLPVKVQDLAGELGREVVVRRIGTDLRLSKDAGLFAELLAKTRFFKELAIKHPANVADAGAEVEKLLRSRRTWDEEESRPLLQAVCRNFLDPQVIARVYAGQQPQARVMEAVEEVLDDAARLAQLERWFVPMHSLFRPVNLSGGVRHKLFGAIAKVFERAAGPAPGVPGPQPLLILDMSGQGLDVGQEPADGELGEDPASLLEQDQIQACILRQVVGVLKAAAERKFKEGEDLLNTLVVFDEAHRYAAPPRGDTPAEVADLSRALEGYARETRKYGIGWFFITQSIAGLNVGIWDQLSVRIVGYGLGGSDLRRLEEHVDDPESLKLYKNFSPPKATNPRVYPFMLVGPVSPLSFTKAPVFLSAYTDPAAFRRDNRHWVERLHHDGLLRSPLARAVPDLPARAEAPPTRAEARPPGAEPPPGAAPWSSADVREAIRNGSSPAVPATTADDGPFPF